MVVEDPDERIGPQGRIERNYVPDGAHAPIRPARAPEERLPRVLKDLARTQGREALTLHGPSVRLTLMAEECAAVVRNLEGNPHAKEYLHHNISSGCAGHPRRPRGAEERGERRRRCSSHEELRR